jgi:hypothetical protein
VPAAALQEAQVFLCDVVTLCGSVVALVRSVWLPACLPACRMCAFVQDKNAAPLNQLDVLMEEVYEHIMELADKVGGLCV